MSVFINLVRYAIAILMPTGAVALSYLTYRLFKKDQASQNGETRTCLNCSQTRRGAFGQFFYTKDRVRSRQREIKDQIVKPPDEILGSESHFICDPCARKYLRNEIRGQVLMAFSYPLYLFVVVPLFVRDGSFSNFLFEILLVFFSIGGAVSAIDLYRTTRAAETPLAEARDRLAVGQRKNSLGKNYSYFTRVGGRNLKESNGSSADQS
jgi:hypothetical protein